ncbi:MucBP domain-containing protein [Liquorilactobacillus sicerae]|uniref:MucBP domain-containing protein n=1 Tax=Liquorilactobacillus sicerae TaxID=1416943 RepID=UPI00248094B5|nr:MucBP domain-containing protein [Liquorilactobacillus sicerae]
MSFKDFLQKIFSFRDQNDHFQNKERFSNSDTFLTSHHNLPPQKEEVTALQMQHSTQDALVLIIYQDDYQREIARPQLISGKLGEKVNFKLHPLPNYDLINIHGFSQLFFSKYAIMVFVYRKQDGAPIFVNFIDFEENFQLHKPLFLRGKIGEAFQVYPPEFDDYKLVSVTGKIKGFYTSNIQVTTIFYQKKDWQAVEMLTAFLKIKKYTPAFKHVEDHRSFLNLHPKTTWKVFKRLLKDNQEIWLNLGSFWVKYQKDQMVLETEMLSTVKLPQKAKLIAIDQTAKINFVANKKVSFFDAPNGNLIGRINDGQQVTTSAKVFIDKTYWYKLISYGWIPGYYLK